jgi:cell division septation protein DedD
MGNMGRAIAGQKPAQAGATLYATVKQQINNLDSQSKQKLLNLVQKSIQQKPAKPAGGGAMGQMAGALAGGQQAPAGQPNTMANAPVSATNTAKPGNPNAASAAPAQAQQPADQAPAEQPTQQAAAPAPQAAPAAAPAEQPAGKMTTQQQNALKARLKAGQGAGAKTGGGFQNYVAGSQEKFQGADASGAPVFKKLQREGAYGFESKFFGGLI